jgi:elongation factor P
VAQIKYIDIRKDMVIVGEDGQLYQCLDRDLNTPGNWRAILQLKLRNLKTGVIDTKRYRPEDKVDLAFLDTREMTYSYREGDSLIFMDSETFEQYPLSTELVADQLGFLRENDTVKVTLFEGKPLSLELNPSVQLKIVETEPAIKGATAKAQTKPAVLETGLKITVPPFVGPGEVVEIDTRTGEYIGRVK